MLRNIPNKVDQAMLKRIIDESSWGKYDFMYLRIDFANDCKLVLEKLQVNQLVAELIPHISVGYAFINFVDVSCSAPNGLLILTMMQPLDIIDVSKGHRLSLATSYANRQM